MQAQTVMATPRLNFAQIHGFPEEFSEGKIETAKFIDASTEVIGILESFGTLFTPVVSDMRGNVNQLRGHYEKDVEQRKFVEDMILADKTMATHPWLLWLKRALELIERFFFYVLQSEEVVKGKEENLSPMIRKAYDEVLRPYHGFLLQNTFKVSRSSLRILQFSFLPPTASQSMSPLTQNSPRKRRTSRRERQASAGSDAQDEKAHREDRQTLRREQHG
jgi:hypothetical protein